MGGRAAETLVFAGDVSTGAADDLQRATEIALEMVTRHGMDGKVGQRTYAPALVHLGGLDRDLVFRLLRFGCLRQRHGEHPVLEARLPMWSTSKIGSCNVCMPRQR